LIAAKEAAEKGVRLFIIGLGDENKGKRIPVYGASGRRTFMKYEGREVWSRLEAETLREMALTAPDYRYLNVATGTIDPGEVYMQLIGSAEKKRSGRGNH
jgi:hypothetical protein